MNKININDPTAWRDLDWDEPEIPSLLKRTDATVNRARTAIPKKNNPVYSNKMKEVAAQRGDEYYENLRDGIANRDNTYQAECNARPEVKKKISDALKGVPKSEEHITALKNTTTNRYGDANYEAAHKAGLARRDKPFHAGEYGIFPSIAEAARILEADGKLSNAYKKLSKWKKEGREGFYFIEK